MRDNMTSLYLSDYILNQINFSLIRSIKVILLLIRQHEKIPSFRKEAGITTPRNKTLDHVRIMRPACPRMDKVSIIIIMEKEV